MIRGIIYLTINRKCNAYFKGDKMEISIIQNIVLIGVGVLIAFMYITSKTLDSIADEIGENKE